MKDFEMEFAPMDRIRHEIVSPVSELYERTYIEKYRNVPSLEHNNLNHLNSFKQQQQPRPIMRPRTPPLPPMPSRSRSRSPIRRHRSPQRYRQSDPFYEQNRSSRQNSSRERPRESRCIGVFGLSDRTTEADIRRHFSRYGYIEDVILIMDNHTRRSRGYCFVYFESLKCAVRAVESSKDLRIGSRFVRVDYSITNRPRSPVHDRIRDDHYREQRYRGRERSCSSHRRSEVYLR